MEVRWSVREKSRINVIQMSEKCRKRPLLKKEVTKAVHQLDENNYQGDEIHANRKKNDSSVQQL